MKVLRKRVRWAVLAAVPLATAACASSDGADGGGFDAGPRGDGGILVDGGQWPICQPSETDHDVLVAPYDGGIDDGGTMSSLVFAPELYDGGLCFPCGVVPEPQYVNCTAVPAAPFTDGGDAWTVSCHYRIDCSGRRPEGLAEPVVATGVGAHFARMAHLEAAAITAFRRLAVELRSHGAPASLVDSARQSAREEAQHARLMSRLAQQHGAVVPRVEVAPVRARTLEALAIENAIEGCVRETFGAAEARLGSGEAPGIVRHAMAAIAPDELHHAELAWEIDAWARTRLDAPAVARVDAARAQAVDELGRAISPSLRPVFESLQQQLWSAPASV